jgi:hypothetical protein
MSLIKKVTQTPGRIYLLIFSLLLGGIVAFLLKEFLTPFLLAGKSYSTRSTFIKIGLFTTYLIIISSVFFVVLIFFRKKTMNLRIFPVVNVSKNQRIYTVLVLIGLGFTLIFFFNNIFPMIDTDSWQLKSFRSFYLMDPVGLDFRTGIYRPPKMVLNNENIYIAQHSNYPPFTILFFMPLQLMGENEAYLFIVPLLLVSNILSLALAAILIADVLFARLPVEKSVGPIMAIFLLLAVLWYTISSYSFLFSIERGNYDSIAFLFAVLAIYLLIKKPESLWLQVILLSIATHLKLYPAVLFLILFLKHGKRIIIPAIVVNILMLLALGYENALLFINVMVGYTLAPVTWVGNHSSFSYADFLYQFYPAIKINLQELRIILTIIPIIIWICSSYFVIKYIKSDFRYIYLLMVSVPLMCTIPTVSHDYKLIILSTSIFIMFSILIYQIVLYSKFWDYILVMVLLGFSYFIGRTFLLFPKSLHLLSNKYPIIIGLTLLMLLYIFQIKNSINLTEEKFSSDLNHDLTA